jgi:cell division protein ZapA
LPKSGPRSRDSRLRVPQGEPSVPLVNIMINQRAYTVACDDGEEEHLRELGKHVDAKARELLESVGQVGDTRLLLMAALLITDEYLDAKGRLESRSRELSDLSTAHNIVQSRAGGSEESATATLEAATKRLSDIAARLSEA